MKRHQMKVIELKIAITIMKNAIYGCNAIEEPTNLSLLIFLSSTTSICFVRTGTLLIVPLQYLIIPDK